jgi:glycosyltransferase involved in cell wall biosynthesis
MVTTFYPPYSFGGDGIFVHRLSNELAQRGHQVDVIHSIDAYRLRKDKPTRGCSDHPNVVVHGLSSPAGMLASLTTQQTGSPLFHSRQIQEILQDRFDVIHYHNISLVGGPKILTYGHGVKLYSIHEYWLICPTHVLFRYNRAACRKPRCFLCSLTYARPPQLWRYTNLLRNAIKHVDAFIAPSQFSANIHRRFGFTQPVMQIPYFAPSVDLAPIKAQSQTGQKPYFLFVGRLEKLKGIRTLVPLFLHYPNARLFIAGAGDQERELRRLAGSSPNIEFLGHLTDQQLQIFYRQPWRWLSHPFASKAFR